MPRANLALCPPVEEFSAPHGRSAPPLALAEIDSWAVTTDRAGFEALEADWNELFARAGRAHQIFLTFNWHWHWCNHYLDSRAGRSTETALSIVTLRRNGRLVLVWPLAMERKAGVRRVVWMGEPVSQYGDVLVDDLPDRTEVLAGGWRLITTTLGADIVALAKVRADAAVAPLLAEACGAPDATEIAPYLNLADTADFDSYEQRYTSKARRNRRRLLRRLEEEGPVAFTQLRSGGEARAAATKAMELKRAWLITKGRISRAFADDRIADFFADVAESRSHPVGCDVFVLTCGGRVASVNVTVTEKGHRGLHVIAYSAEFERRGVGVLHLEDCLRRCFGDGVRTFDLLAPRADYKMDWADGAVDVFDYSRTLTLAGRLYRTVYIDLIAGRLRRLAELMPRSLLAAVTWGYWRARAMLPRFVP